MLTRLKKSNFPEYGLLLLITGLVFGPFLFRLTYFRDDWYYMLDSLLGGPGIFHAMFASDRPWRGYFFELYASLFGQNPVYYQLGAYFWRVTGAGAFLWLFRLMWPSRRQEALWGALLFVLYPGYLWWVSAIEYQPMLASLCIELLSIGLTIQALRCEAAWRRALCAAGAILTGWIYIALVDYAIGMEIFRFLAVYLALRDPARGWLPNLVKAVRAWAWMVIIPAGFLFWRVFLFQNERKATDVGLQLGRLFDTTGLSGGWGLVHWLQSSLNVLFLAWGTPFYNSIFSLRLRDIALGFLITGFCLVITLLAEAWLFKSGQSESGPERLDLVWLGVLGVFLGVLPVVAANRTILFERFSHYALPTAPAGVMALIGLVFLISDLRMRRWVLAALMAVAVLTNYATGVQALAEEQAIQKFWWQVTWRVPGFAPGTSLMFYYPNISYGEDYEVVLGPANFIYFSEPVDSPSPQEQWVTYRLASLSQTGETLKLIQVGRQAVERNVRSHHFVVDYGNVIVASQPSEAACVHVMDPRWPVYSTADSAEVQLSGPHSAIQNVLTHSSHPPVLPEELFGLEPAHEWCYFYQKADLARQQGDWQSILQLAAKAETLGARPVDPIEWLPFVQAYAYAGEMQKVKEISTRINSEPFYKQQTCQALTQMEETGSALPPENRDNIRNLFCGRDE
jgi:hypothetical protein